MTVNIPDGRGSSRGLRKPTGKPSWPVLLLAGREKTGKSYSAAKASASDLVDRTFWVGFGEKDPDEYGAIPGARFEIAYHDGSLTDLRLILEDLLKLDTAPGEKPHLWVIDSSTMIWDTLRDRATGLAMKRGSKNKDGDPIVSMDLWNKVKGEWLTILNLIRKHNGPVIMTARLEESTVMRNGKPTTEKINKVQGQKSLVFDVDGIIEMPVRGEAYLTGARSVIHNLPERMQLRDFDQTGIDGLWRNLGLGTVEVAQPTYTAPEPVQMVEAPSE